MRGASARGCLDQMGASKHRQTLLTSRSNCIHGVAFCYDDESLYYSLSHLLVGEGNECHPDQNSGRSGCRA